MPFSADEGYARWYPDISTTPPAPADLARESGTDLNQMSDFARMLVTRYGMDPESAIRAARNLNPAVDAVNPNMPAPELSLAPNDKFRRKQDALNMERWMFEAQGKKFKPANEQALTGPPTEYTFIPSPPPEPDNPMSARIAAIRAARARQQVENK